MNKLESLVVMPVRDGRQVLLGYIAYVRFQDSKDNTDMTEWSRNALQYKINRYIREKTALAGAAW